MYAHVNLERAVRGRVAWRDASSSLRRYRRPAGSKGQTEPGHPTSITDFPPGVTAALPTFAESFVPHLREGSTPKFREDALELSYSRSCECSPLAMVGQATGRSSGRSRVAKPCGSRIGLVRGPGRDRWRDHGVSEGLVCRMKPVQALEVLCRTKEQLRARGQSLNTAARCLRMSERLTMPTRRVPSRMGTRWKSWSIRQAQMS